MDEKNLKGSLLESPRALETGMLITKVKCARESHAEYIIPIYFSFKLYKHIYIIRRRLGLGGCFWKNLLFSKHSGHDIPHVNLTRPILIQHGV